MGTKKKSEAEVNKGIILDALRTAISAYEQDEKSFRQIVEDIKNGRPTTSMFVGEAGAKIAKKMGDDAWKRAQDAKAVLAEMDGESEEAAS